MILVSRGAIQQRTATALATTQTCNGAQHDDVTFQHVVISKYNVLKYTFTVRQLATTSTVYFSPVSILNVLLAKNVSRATFVTQ